MANNNTNVGHPPRLTGPKTIGIYIVIHGKINTHPRHFSVNNNNIPAGEIQQQQQ